tara:strand:+ start:530 stop:922 length:393 start_codon:yes stop_codon:yes gene_type:complete
MNKDIPDKEAMAQKIAQMQDSGESPGKSLLDYLQGRIDEEKKKRQEAEGELSIIKTTSVHNSPEMRDANSRIKELEIGLSNALEVNESHQKLNGKIQVRLTEVEEDNKKLAKQVEDLSNIVQKLRNDGVL